MTLGRADVRQSLQSVSFDTIDFVKATRTMNLDKLTALLMECKMESRCELSDNVTAQYEMFVNLYDDISMVGKDEIKAVDGQLKRLLHLINVYIQDVEKLNKTETENAAASQLKKQSIIDNNSLMTMQSIIKQVKSELGAKYESDKILFQYSLLERLTNTTRNGRAHELFMDFKEELKVKLEQLSLSCLYDMNDTKWQYVCSLFCGLEKADELADLVYKAKVQPLIFRCLSKTSNSPFNSAIETIVHEIGEWPELATIYNTFSISDYHEMFVIGSIWRPLAEAILERTELFSPTHQERFHDSYIAVCKLVDFVERNLLKSNDGLKMFRAAPSVLKLRNEWQFNVYFQLLFRAFANKFEHNLKDSTLDWQVIYDCAMEIMSEVWGERVFLRPLLAKFLRLSLQMEGRCRMAVIPKILEQSLLPESGDLGRKLISDMERMNSLVQEKIKVLIEDEPLRTQLLGLLEKSMTSTRQAVDDVISKLPAKFVSKLMSSMEAILTGSSSLHALLNQCVVGLEESEREQVLQEFSEKFTERAGEYWRQAVKREENWKRLQQMSLEDNEMTDVQQPEPLDLIKGRILTALDQLAEYSASACIGELKESMQ